MLQNVAHAQLLYCSNPPDPSQRHACCNTDCTGKCQIEHLGPAVSAARHGSDRKGAISLAIAQLLAMTSDPQGLRQFTDFH